MQFSLEKFNIVLSRLTTSKASQMRSFLVLSPLGSASSENLTASGSHSRPKVLIIVSACPTNLDMFIPCFPAVRPYLRVVGFLERTMLDKDAEYSNQPTIR